MSDYIASYNKVLAGRNSIGRFKKSGDSLTACSILIVIGFWGVALPPPKRWFKYHDNAFGHATRIIIFLFLKVMNVKFRRSCELDAGHITLL